jgi:hypothetical protein
VTQQRLAELTVTDPAALGRSLDRLEVRGWAKRRLLVRILNRILANLKMHQPDVAAAMPLETATRLQETAA